VAWSLAVAVTEVPAVGEDGLTDRASTTALFHTRVCAELVPPTVTAVTAAMASPVAARVFMPLAGRRRCFA
jgi:hypothetical protein